MVYLSILGHQSAYGNDMTNEKEDFETLQDCVQDMKQSAEAIGLVLNQIKDNDVTFNKRLSTLEAKHDADIKELSQKLASFHQDLNVLKTAVKQIGDTQGVMQSTIGSKLRQQKSSLKVRKNSNSDQEEQTARPNRSTKKKSEVVGEGDSGVNLGALVYSSNTSDQDSTQSRSTSHSVGKNCDEEFVKERIHQFVEDASNLCNNSTQYSTLSNNDEMQCFNSAKPWTYGEQKMLYRTPSENRLTNDSGDSCLRKFALALLQCERTICNAISEIQTCYYDPLKYADIISSRDLNSIFPNELFRIYEQHCMILHKVQEITNDWCNSLELLIGVYLKIFAPQSYLICLYNDYISSFPQISKSIALTFNDSSECVRHLIRHQSMKQRQVKTIRLNNLQCYMASPMNIVKQYIMIFKNFIKRTDVVPRNTVEKIEMLLESVKSLLVNANEDHCPTAIVTVNDDDQLTPPLKPKRNKHSRRISTPNHVQHSLSEDVVSTLEKKTPHFERHNCSTVSRKQRKLRLTYSGSETNLHGNEFETESVENLPSPKLTSQLDAVSEPSIYRELKQHDFVDPASTSYESGKKPNVAALSRSHQCLAAKDNGGVVDFDEFHRLQMAKRNRRSLVKQVGGLRNSVAAFFSRRKNERRFGGDLDNSSSRSLSQSGNDQMLNKSNKMFI